MKKITVNLMYSGIPITGTFIVEDEAVEEVVKQQFVSLFDDPKEEQEKEPITEKQSQFLLARGYGFDYISQMSKQEAQARIGEIKQRETESLLVPLETKVRLSDEFKKICKEPLCGQKAKAKGMCNKHYLVEYKKLREEKLKGGEKK